MTRSRVTRVAAALVLLATFAWPIVAASDPEISDPREVAEAHPRAGMVNVVVPEGDITAVRLSSNATHVAVRWEVVDPAHRTPGSSGAAYSLTYRDARYDLGHFSATRIGEAWRFTWTGTTASGGDAALASGTTNGGAVEMSVPKTYFGGEMTHLRAGTILLVSTGPGSHQGGGPAWARDWAPNEGYGRDFHPG